MAGAITGSVAVGFRTFGFIHYPSLLSPREVEALSNAFDAAMERAERHRPTPSGDRPGRRAIHVSAVQNATPVREEHLKWLTGFLGRETEAWGRLYSDRLVATATPRRQRMLARAIELGFGTTGRITHLQDLR